MDYYKKKVSWEKWQMSVILIICIIYTQSKLLITIPLRCFLWRKDVKIIEQKTLSVRTKIQRMKHTWSDMVCISISRIPISLPNPLFDHLLESSHRDDSNKWSNIWFGEEIIQVVLIDANFMLLSAWCSVTYWSDRFCIVTDTVWKQQKCPIYSMNVGFLCSICYISNADLAKIAILRASVKAWHTLHSSS